jgi:hypothetical protein
MVIVIEVWPSIALNVGGCQEDCVVLLRLELRGVGPVVGIRPQAEVFEMVGLRGFGTRLYKVLRFILSIHEIGYT